MNEYNIEKKLDESKVIRKLGFGESLYDNELINKNMFQTRVFIVSIAKEHSLNMDTLNKALNAWIKTHTLLQATTYRELDPKQQRPLMSLPRYFIRMNKNIPEYNNVEILNETNELKWTDLVEAELKTSLDYIHGPLWRLKCMKLQDSLDLNKYAFVLTTSHSISDGRNGYSIGVQLLDILIDVLEDKLSDEIQPIPSDLTSEQALEKYKLKLGFKIVKEETDFDFGTHRIPNNVGNKNGVHGRFDFIFIESEILDKLIKKMKLKAPKAKLTSLLLILLCDSYKRACIKHKVTNIPLDRIQVAVLASLRDKLSIKNTQMGVYSNVLMSSVNFNADLRKKENTVALPSAIFNMALFIPKFAVKFLMENIVMKISFLRKGFFKIITTVALMQSNKIYQNEYKDMSEERLWNLAENESMLLHKRISNNEELAFEIDDLFVDLLDNNFDFGNHSSTNFCLSNIGIMNNTKNANLVKLKEHYVAVPCLENRFGAVLQFGITTIEKSLNCAISFNEKIFSKDFIRDIKKYFLESIDKIIN